MVLDNKGKLLIIDPDIDSEVSLLFWAIEDETNIVKNARKAIINSEFEIIKKESFLIKWIFNDVKELYKYFFDYYKLNETKKVIERFNKILKNKVTDSPIVVYDKITIFLLRKR